MIVGAFISHNDDWILPHKLKVYSQFCDLICVLLDRSPQSIGICARFEKCRVIHVNSDPFDLGDRHDGPTWSEGKLRQSLWDWVASFNPEYVVLGDTDEIPSRGIVEFLGNVRRIGPDVNCWYAEWPQLMYDDSRWLSQTASPLYSTLKGLIVRYDASRPYVYDQGKRRHCRLEPSPVNQMRAVIDDCHKLSPVKLVHYRFANWTRWQAGEQSKLAAYQPWPPDDAAIDAVPADWIWRWNADDLIASMPDEVCVVGNGPCTGRGQQIDSHDYVIRLNNWRADGYEQHVGSKVDAWCCNCWDDIEPREWYGDMLCVHNMDQQPERITHWRSMYPHMHVPETNWLDDAREIKHRKPSTGLVLLRALAKAGKRVTAFGFDGLATGHYWDREHIHDHPPERDALRALPVNYQ